MQFNEYEMKHSLMLNVMYEPEMSKHALSAYNMFKAHTCISIHEAQYSVRKSLVRVHQLIGEHEHIRRQRKKRSRKKRRFIPAHR